MRAVIFAIAQLSCIRPARPAIAAGWPNNYNIIEKTSVSTSIGFPASDELCYEYCCVELIRLERWFVLSVRCCCQGYLRSSSVLIISQCPRYISVKERWLGCWLLWTTVARRFSAAAIHRLLRVAAAGNVAGASSALMYHFLYAMAYVLMNSACALLHTL